MGQSAVRGCDSAAVQPTGGSHAGSYAASQPRGQAGHGQSLGGGAGRSSHSQVELARAKAREYQLQLRQEERQMDREIRRVQNEEAALLRNMKAEASKGRTQAVQLLAKSVVRSRAAVRRLEKTKASMHALNLQLMTNVATMSMKSSLQLSTDMMREMNELAGAQQIGATMEEMRRQMDWSAEAEEQMAEVFHDDEEEEEASAEVQKVLDEMELSKIQLLQSTQAMPSYAARPAQMQQVPRQDSQMTFVPRQESHMTRVPRQESHMTHIPRQDSYMTHVPRQESHMSYQSHVLA